MDWNTLLSLAENELELLRRTLPEALQRRLDAVTLFYDERPADYLIDDGVEEDTMGLFEGPTFAEDGISDISPSMTLFLLNIWDEAGEEERLFKREVRTTLLHELGHYLGLNEDDLRKRKLD
jgi:predicted Zn-dependent protease with MMP-like domain